jgi:fucose 4-O-acetylase-like acetyltransferase
MRAGNASDPDHTAPSASAPIRDAGRDQALDIVKGVGIVLVVLGHAWRGLDAAGLIGNASLYAAIDRLIYNFHMPLFFLVSGLTFAGWASRRSLADALASRVGRILYPFVLWTYLFTLMRLLAGDAVNSPVDGLGDVFAWPLPPRDHLWFLWALFLQHVLVLLVIAILPNTVAGWAWLSATVLAVLGASIWPDLFGVLTIGAFTHLGAFLFGIWLGQTSWRPSGTGAALVALATFVLLQTASLVLPGAVDGLLLVRQVLGIVLAVALLVFVRAIAEQSTTPWPGSAACPWASTFRIRSSRRRRGSRYSPSRPTSGCTLSLGWSQASWVLSASMPSFSAMVGPLGSGSEPDLADRGRARGIGAAGQPVPVALRRRFSRASPSPGRRGPPPPRRGRDRPAPPM